MCWYLFCFVVYGSLFCLVLMVGCLCAFGLFWFGFWVNLIVVLLFGGFGLLGLCIWIYV